MLRPSTLTVRYNTCCSIALSFWAPVPREVASATTRFARIRRVDFAAGTFSSDLLFDFEGDLELNRHSERKASNAHDRSNRHLVGAKDIAKQIRDCVRDSGLIEEVPEGCDEHAEPDDAGDSIE